MKLVFLKRFSLATMGLKNDFVYDQLLQDINQQFIADLREELR